MYSLPGPGSTAWKSLLWIRKHISFDSLATHVQTIPAEFGLSPCCSTEYLPFSQWKRSQPETLSVCGVMLTFLSLRAVQTLWQESSSICKCLCDYWCCCLRDVKLLLGFIPEIWKSVAILGPHKDPKEPCLSVSLMLVAVVYFQYLFQKNSQENIKKADFDLIFLIQSSILRWFQTGLRHSFSQMLILCSHCDGMDHYTL